MSESKFTPGPWFVEQLEKTSIYVSPVGRHENISICNVLTMDEDDSESGDWINGGETKANAKLIAAAPDLMELANRVVEEFKNYERIGEICPFEGQPMIYAAVLVELAEFAKIVQAKATA